MRVQIFTWLILLLFRPSTVLFSQILINEHLSLNLSGILDEDQEYNGWVEIFNSSNDPVSIAGYGLSDESAVPLKWTFPDAILPAKKHLMVFTSGKDRRQMPMDFETIIDAGDEWRYLAPSSDIGTAWRDISFDDIAWQSGSSGFGYSDNDDSTLVPSSAFSLFVRKSFTLNDIASVSRLILSVDYDDGFVAYINGHEVARSNLGSYGENTPWDHPAATAHEAAIYSGGKPEYFEIANPSSIIKEGINVIAIQVHNNIIGSSDMTLTPFLTIGRMEGAYKISKWLTFPSTGGLHTSFIFNSATGSLYLSNASGEIADSTGMITMVHDVSYGRQGDGSLTRKYFGIPTPGAVNSSAGSDMVLADSVVFSPSGGLFLGGTTVTLTTANGSTDSIFYTTDGSLPGRSDQLYTGPINVSITRVIRARAMKYNKVPGPVVSRTFITALDHDLPVVSLTTDPFNLWDNLAGIYAFGPNTPTQMPYYEANYWRDWERPVHVELYDSEGILQVDQMAGMKIFGGWSRAQPQKSVALFARKNYGKGAFRYRFFKTKPIDKFESIVLRNSGNDNMGLQFHDCFMTGLARDMDIDVQAYQPAAVYINGEYWGLLNIREKVSDHFVAGNYKVDADSVNLLEYNGQVINGDNADYLQLREFMEMKTTLQSSADLDYVLREIDKDNFIQYQLFNIYLNNRDWPGNNIKYWNTRASGSKWRWISFDTDFGFGIWNENDYQLNTLEFAIDPSGPEWPNPPWSTLFLRRLLTNQAFRKDFINQFCDRLNQDFHPSRINADLDSLKLLYSNEIQYTFNRWDASYDDWLAKYDGWLYRIGTRKTFGQYRPSYCRQHLQSAFQLGNQQTVIVNVSDINEGLVKLNSIYVNSYPFSGIYFKNLPISMTAIPRPGYKFSGWTGTVASMEPQITYNMSTGGNFKANFTPATNEDISIIINEINYNSSETLDTKDWIELHNDGIATVDLGNWQLTDSDIDSGFVFPAGTLMVPGSYLVICRDTKDFRAYNPNVENLIGNLSFKLSSDGDIVRLYDNNSQLVDAVNFGTTQPWPPDAKGTGKTLELKNPALDNSYPESWHAMVIGGTPGTVNTADTAIVANIYADVPGTFDCFPNPFREFTTISFTTSGAGVYRLEVIDLQGRRVRLLHDGELKAGSYWIDWDGEGSVPGAIYTVRLTSPSGVSTLKVVKL